MLAISLLAAAPGHAHPAGSSSINRYLHFEHVGGGRFRVAYLLDFAEAPAYAEIDALDADHDGAVTPDEQRRYLDARLPPIIASWVVEVNGDRATPAIVASHLETLPGQGGLETLRIDCELAVQGRAPPAGEDTRLHVRDDTFADHPGWRDITASEGPAADDTQAATGSVDPADGGAGRRAPRVSDATFVLQLRTPGPRVERPARTGLALVAAALAVGAGLVVTWIARLLRSLSRLRRS
jgi:hypothetical protein